MNPSSTLLHGSQQYVEAHRWLKRSGRLKWLLWPLLCSLLMLPVYGYAVYYTTVFSLQGLVGYFDWPLYGWAYWLAFPVILLMGLFVVYILLKNIIMLLCVPLNAVLADAVISEQLGHAAQSWTDLLRSMLRAILMTLLVLIITLMMTLLLLILGFIPVAGAIAAFVLGIGIQGFLAAWGFFDPIYERAGVGIYAGLRRSLKLLPHSLSNGIPFMLLFQIPVLGWTLAPTYGAVAGALHACQLYKQGKLV